jgi:cation diffusion facilitator CzcD-associated flavoprotein CzcO
MTSAFILAYNRFMTNEDVPKPTLKIAVIGAGPCGLAVCKTLKEFKLDFECFEASDRVGGVWNVEYGGSGYRSLRTNTSTRGMAFSDFPFPEGAPDHPSAAEMVDYFSSYAKHFAFLEKIRFNTRVAKTSVMPDGSWKLEFDNGDSSHYSNLIVATGKYSKPRMPFDVTSGVFNGQAFHATDYLDVQSPFDLRDKRVVVVGLGSSGAEIATDLANNSSLAGHASFVTLSARSGRWVIPKIINGKPADAVSPHPSARLPLILRYLPNQLGLWLVRQTLGRAFRRQVHAQQALLNTKLPTPSIQPWEDRPTLSSDFIPALQSGLVNLKPGIERFDGATVLFSDGSSTQADAIIYATGYQAHIPFISPQILGEQEAELALYKRIAHAKHDNLFFVGYCPVLCSMWPVAEQQSRWIARLLSGAFQMPAATIRKRQSVHLENSLPVICSFYVEELRKEAKGL